MINEYKFGSITVDGRTYNHDVEVRWTGEILPWRRKESHIIDVADVKRAIGESPDTVIISTGESGIARVAEEVERFILEKGGIKLIIDKTAEATKTFNIINEESELEDGKQNKVIGLFHLTC